MNANWRSCGPVMNLNKRDRALLDRGKKVYSQQKVMRNEGEWITLCLSLLQRPYHLESERIEDCSLEDGWKVRSSPSHPVRMAAREREHNSKYLPLREIRVSISPKLWERLKTEGYIGTRSLYDRIELTYWEEGMHP